MREKLDFFGSTDDAFADLFQTLADVDLTFTVLKHPSNEVRGLVKQLVRKWKDLVDEWVGLNNSALEPE
ncbi:putative transcription factor IIS, TFIIS/LEDGF domain superfamily [Helianthus annuus]|nr:putative transcription factor IIS, TFIIS/LEDGF domain superfamily [Helianthus annuus]